LQVPAPPSPVSPGYYGGNAGGVPAGGGQMYYVPVPRPLDPTAIQMAPGKHSPAMAIICSLLLTGMGQMVNKQTNKGIVILISCIVAGLATFGIGGFVIAVLAAIDAGIIAGRLNRGEAVGQWQWF
jgi:TM2 domain-containing membrane protein YozV